MQRLNRPFSSTSRLLTAALACGVIWTAGCSDDDKPTTPEGATIEVPADATLAEALARAGHGDVIRLAEGTYSMTETLVVSSEHAGVTLRGAESGERPVLDFSSMSVGIGIRVDEGADEFAVDNLTITGFAQTGVLVRANDVTVSRCRIEDGSRYSVSAVTPVEGLRIEDNLLVNAGIFGVHLTSGASAEVVSNTIDNANDCGIYTSDAAPVCRQNLIIHSFQFGIACFGNVVPDLACNLIYDSGSADYSSACEPGDDDITEQDPLLWNEETYELRPESPCAPTNSAGCGLIGAMGVAAADPSK